MNGVEVVPEPGRMNDSGLDDFRRRGYWASCFPEGDGINFIPRRDQSDEQQAHDVRETFGWEVANNQMIADELQPRGQVHELKCWPEPFAAVWSGLKRFEWRKDDRGYAVGDTLRLREWNPVTQTYSGAECWRRVTWLVRGRAFDIPDGYCIMSVDPCAAQEVPST